MSRPVLKRLLPAAKVVLAFALLAWLFSAAHWHDYTAADDSGRQVARMGLASSLKEMSLALMVLAVALLMAALVASALRWRLLLAAQGVHLAVKETLRMTLLGDFLSMAIPGTVGGDAIKAYLVVKSTPRKSGVLVSTLADRLIGLCGLAALALVMLIVTWALRLIHWQAAKTAAVSIAVAVVAILAALAVLLSPRLRRILGLYKLFRRPLLQRYVVGAGHAVAALIRRPRVLAKGAALSLVSHSLQVCGVLLIGLGLGLPLEWYRYFLYVPIILIIASVPLTPGGLGVAEQLYLIYLGGAGDGSKVLALALLVRLAVILSVLPGALILASGPRLPATETIRMELDAAEAHAP